MYSFLSQQFWQQGKSCCLIILYRFFFPFSIQAKLQTGFQLDHSLLPLAGGIKGSIQSCIKILYGLPVKSQRKKNLREIIIKEHQK